MTVVALVIADAVVDLDDVFVAYHPFDYRMALVVAVVDCAVGAVDRMPYFAVPYSVVTYSVVPFAAPFVVAYFGEVVTYSAVVAYVVVASCVVASYAVGVSVVHRVRNY